MKERPILFSTPMRKCGIYKITSPSGKIYIGKSINIIHRIWKYKSMNCKSQTKLLNSLMKYGWEKHCFEIIVECQREDLDKLEMYHIDILKSNVDGLNITAGGGGTLGRKLSDDAKKKIGLFHKGKKLSQETLIRMSLSLKGMKPWNKGIKMSHESKIKLSKSLKGRKSPCGMKGKKWSKETREKIVIANKGKSRNKGKIAYQYPVLQFSINGEFIKEWVSARIAAKELNLNESLISSCCHKRRKKTGGYVWKHK